MSPQHGASSGCGWRNGLQLWRVAANVLNKQPRTNDKGWSSSWGVGLRKQAKLQWLQDPSEISGDNLNIVRREASRYFRHKKLEYLKDKINELATNSKNKNMRDVYRGINEFKRCCQPRNN
jgi:hypothetical protein